MLVRVNLVSYTVEGVKESRRRNDSKEAANVHNAVRTQGILCAKHASGKNELHWKESWPLSNEQRR